MLIFTLKLYNLWIFWLSFLFLLVYREPSIAIVFQIQQITWPTTNGSMELNIFVKNPDYYKIMSDYAQGFIFYDSY